MQLENSFEVAAAPERVFAYLVDVNRVVGCVPGAELSEVVDPTTFKGKVKIKVGPISVAYSGTARISEQDADKHTATMEAEGRETSGPGSARAKVLMSVEAGGAGSVVKVVTDYQVAGRIAQFGRGGMEDVSRRLVNEMAACIKANLEGSGSGSEGAAGSDAPSGTASASDINGLALFFAVLGDGFRRLLRRLFPAKTS